MLSMDLDNEEKEEIKLMNNSAAPNTIEFYCDPISPYAWLASSRLDEIQLNTHTHVIVKPILFAGLLKAHGNIGPAEIEAKRVYTFRDVMRRAKDLALPMESVPNHPFNPLLALRICTAIEDDAVRRKVAVTLFDAAWSKGRDITVESDVREIVASCGLDADWAITASNDPIVKQALVDNTNAAIELGIFGVPTFRFNDQIFWGEDRIREMLSYINGQRIDEAKLQEILAREAAVHRKR